MISRVFDFKVNQNIQSDIKILVSDSVSINNRKFILTYQL
jgi:hypothetical protein